jgi:hypothetical protein
MLSRYSDKLRVGRTGFDSQQRQEILFFSTVSRPAVGFTQPPALWVPGALSPRKGWPGRKDGNSLPSSAEIKSGGAISLLPPHIFHGVVLTSSRLVG